MSTIIPPSWHLLRSEPRRAARELFEFAASHSHIFTAAPPPPKKEAPPIIVSPGILAPDIMTWGLRKCFQHAGYYVYDSGVKVNLVGRRHIETLEDTARRAADKHGYAPILIGHSAGGIISAAAAYRGLAPIQEVYTLGTPFKRDGANPFLVKLHSIMTRLRGEEDMVQETLGYFNAPPPVPITAIRSSADGIVACAASGNMWDGHETITLDEDSHIGMVMNKRICTQLLDLIEKKQEADCRRTYQYAPNREASANDVTWAMPAIGGM